MKAFHRHVCCFFEILLGCTWDPEMLHIDGIAASGKLGVLTFLSAFFAAIEPQMRGSLHLHCLLHLLGFSSPQALLDKFLNLLPLPEARLWVWVKSICFTSIEAIPPFLGVSEHRGMLQSLQPLPYSRNQLEMLTPT